MKKEFHILKYNMYPLYQMFYNYIHNISFLCHKHHNFVEYLLLIHHLHLNINLFDRNISELLFLSHHLCMFENNHKNGQ